MPAESPRPTAPPQIRQADLLRIATDLFAERGYAATTVRDIAKAAGILPRSLYRHFDSKEAILDRILWAFIDETLARYEAVLAEGKGPGATFEGLVRASFAPIVESRSEILIYQNEARFFDGQPRFGYLRETHREFERIWTDVLTRGVDSGEFRPGIDARLVYRLVRDSVWSAPRWYDAASNPVTPEAVVDQYLAVLVEGIAVRSR